MENALGDLISQQVRRLGNRVDTQVLIDELLGSSPINDHTIDDNDIAFSAERLWEEVGDISDEDIKELCGMVAVRELRLLRLLLSVLATVYVLMLGLCAVRRHPSLLRAA